jgi:hypothetical protein
VVLDAAWSYWRQSTSDTSFASSVILVYEDDVRVVVVDFAASVVISATILFPEVVSVSGVIRVLDASVVNRRSLSSSRTSPPASSSWRQGMTRRHLVEEGALVIISPSLLPPYYPAGVVLQQRHPLSSSRRREGNG